MMRPALSRCCRLGALTFLFGGCDAVPTLTFPDGAVTDGGQPDAVSPDRTDATADASTPTGCPDTPPDGASVCCGLIACTGDCEAHCLECEGKCTSANPVCCVKNGVNCHMPGFMCN
jgi:hypothetical protein